MKPESDVKDFEAELKKDYNFRLERRNEYLVKYKPMEDVVLVSYTHLSLCRQNFSTVCMMAVMVPDYTTIGK